MAISNACLKYAKEKHECPHCNKALSCCATPPMHVGDGLGWGTDVFFICLNDTCSLYVNGWQHIENQYGKVASYRYMLLPGEKKGTPMMVGSSIAFTGNVIEIDQMEEQNERHMKEKESLAQLDSCIKDKNLEPIIFLITDEESALPGRERACELLVDLEDIGCIDPIRNHKFRHESIGQLADLAIRKMLKNTFQRECSFCSEIIKSQAQICKHCGK